jgi:hypothetical protein
MSTKTYYELLRDPRWQKKRLQIMDRAGFRCEHCDEDPQTLNIHHSYYEKGLKPWEYPDESLHCLCEKCHKKTQNIKAQINRLIGTVPLTYQTQILGYVAALAMDNDSNEVFEVTDYEMAYGIGDYYKLKAEAIIDALVECTIDGHKLEQMINPKIRK